MADPYEDDIRRLVNTIRQITRLLGESPESLAEAAGLSAAEIRAIFDGSLKLEVHHLYRLAKAIGAEPLDFFRLSSPRPKMRRVSFRELEEIMEKANASYRPGGSEGSGPTDPEAN